MLRTRSFGRIAIVPIALSLLGAMPAPQIIPVGGGGDEALIIPANSPVKFRGFDKFGTARFGGRFTLTGTFSYSCADCEPGARFRPRLKPDDLELEVVPDADLAARLPHWRIHRHDIIVEVRGANKLAETIGNRRERAALFSGKIDALRGRMAIVVVQLRSDTECDSATWWASFVAVVQPPKLSTSRPIGNFGCT